jgi:hypothetical protein
MFSGDTASLVKARRVGGSLVVTLPKEIVESKMESKRIREGEILRITSRKARNDGFGALKKATSFITHDGPTAHE